MGCLVMLVVYGLHLKVLSWLGLTELVLVQDLANSKILLAIYYICKGLTDFAAKCQTNNNLPI